MNSKRLMNAIGGIEDKYIEAAESTPQATYAAVSSRNRSGCEILSDCVLVIVVALAAIFGAIVLVQPFWQQWRGCRS